jgi:DNA polymerase III subunit alpha
MADDFVHIHTHSEYSLLDGLGRVKDLVKEAKRLKQPALALTDHGSMHGAIEFFRACKGAEIKPLIGVESYQTVWGRPKEGRSPQFDKENYHQLLIARNMTGYHNLLKLVSQSHVNGFYYKPRMDHALLEQYAEGLICTTGCLGAEVPQLLMQGREKEAYERLGWYVDLFGKENFFIELQEHSIDELKEVNKILAPWADKFGIQLLVTNDVHYVREEDSTPHEVLLCVQTGTRMQDEKRMRLSDQSYFLKSRAQMEATFRPLIDLPASAFDSSVLIAEMCEVDLEDPTYHLPDLPIPDGFTYASYLRHLTEVGLRRLYGDRADDPEVQERKERELRIIGEMGFDVYFLIVADLCDFARNRGIWWNVRGSGAGSLVAYCTGITGLDPLKNNLIFERFLNPGRVTMPDFDLDYPDDQREEMIRYTVEKYGSDQVAQIVTFGRMKARAAIRDVGRAKDIPLDQVDRIAKLIPAIPGKPVTIRDVLTEGHEFYNPELVEVYQKESWVQDLLETSMQLEGVARHAGIHAAAVIVADRHLEHYTPLMRGTKSTITGTITQYEFPILESIGLLKVDFLGLSTLTVLREACRLIKEQHGIEYRLDNIPFEGEEAEPAFKLLSSGEVSGVFQVESQGMRRVLTEMKPSTFEHIVATISLYRPGPLEYIPQFIRRMHGEEEVEYKHPALEPILAETYGIIVYQEDIIRILADLAGYTPGEADLVRRAIGKKKASEIEYHKKIFIEGCSKNGILKEAATAIYEDIEFFARYGFNKCLPGDVEVVDAATGRLVRVEDLYTGAAQLQETLTCDTGALTVGAGRVSAVMDNGVKPVYRLTTRLGRQIEATANHPFYTFDGWRLLEELAPGVQIAVPRRLPVEGRQVWPDHEVIVLGHLLAEVNLCHPHSVYFYSQDGTQVEDYVAAVEHFENVQCSIAPHKETFSVYAKRLDRTLEPGVVPWAWKLGIWGKDARAKEIPAAAFELGNRQIGLLLSRMWEADGHINVKGRSLSYATASERMARQMQHLFLRLGIVSRLRRVEFPYKEGRIGYQLFVTGNENIQTFAAQIGCHFVSNERRAKLDQLAIIPQASGTRDVIPMGVKHTVRSAKERAGVTWTELNATCGVAQREFYSGHAATKRGFTRQTIERLATHFEDADLRRYAHSDIYWDEIESIQYIGEKQTYDLEVPETHNFIANDILVHNSHAADYAVITVQTAYLKALYPVEYMAALLLVERDKTEKVVNFINECRRMGIQVLPPDVNYSDMDFTSQAVPADSAHKALTKDPSIAYDFPVPPGAAIRFGMAAVKNVGEGPVSVILEARKEGGHFRSLEDFCDRVDLRHVNKRSLECLIKVGALDRFGHRRQLLSVLDQLVARSAGSHSAKDSGQISMFDLLGDVGEPQEVPIVLPKVDDVKSRERLQWEKELLGVYASSHPTQQLKVDLMNIVTCSCAELGEEHDDKVVTIGGMIADIRTTITKKGDKMAFLRLEDLLGQCEVVLFPRTYEQYKDQIEPDRVILVVGKAQARNGRTSVLAEEIRTSLEIAREVIDDETRYQEKLIDMPTFNGKPSTPQANGHSSHSSWENGMDGYDLSNAPVLDEPDPFANEMPDWLAAELDDRPELVAGNKPEVKENKPQPPGEELRPNAEPKSPPVVTSAGPTASSATDLEDDASKSTSNDASAPDKAAQITIVKEKAPPQDAPTAESTEEEEDGAPTEPSLEAEPEPEPATHPTPRTTEHAPRSTQHENGVSNGNGHTRVRRLLKITFSRSGQLERDKYRLREIVETVRDPRGRDQFVIIMENDGKRHQLTFPNDFCNISDRLVGELQKYFNVDVVVDA